MLSVSFGVYVHIPYCLQRCPYCDFAVIEMTEEISRDSSFEKYTSLVIEEIQQRSASVGARRISSLYFGGGTPSLVEPGLLSKIVESLRKEGFELETDYEMTLEINPGTITEKSLREWVAIGVNRFSVGAQSFDDGLLKKIGRKHSSKDTRATLELLHGAGLNFTLDILFALPGQTRTMLLKDAEAALTYSPPHVSVYCLTLPDKHPLNDGRPEDIQQAEMFEDMEKILASGGLTRYEVSNYSKPGRESRHNRLYWSDDEYWGVGLSAHSYLKKSEWGVRFWNSPGLKSYSDHIASTRLRGPATPFDGLPENQVEILAINQAMTDYCHTHLRTLTRGVTERGLKDKFPPREASEIMRRLEKLHEKGLVDSSQGRWVLSRNGRLLADRVFEELTFLKN
ncbi:MAG: radical SAM family heme chaperone HemW [Bdellovibrionia bacterium]